MSALPSPALHPCPATGMVRRMRSRRHTVYHLVSSRPARSGGLPGGREIYYVGETVNPQARACQQDEKKKSVTPAGVGSSSSLQRSMKCSRDVERSLRFAAFHFLMNAEGGACVRNALCLCAFVHRSLEKPQMI